MENSTAMLGGESANSYFRHSNFQKQAADQSKSLIIESIIDLLELNNDSRAISIADLGCSVGPNTFSTVSTMIEAVKIKCEKLEKAEAPEFHVFFNDQVSNDFNTLFRALPEDREYLAAGVPGSFHSRLFPKNSINLMNSTMALHWITKLPLGLGNKGRVTYARSSNDVIEAFRAQFYSDVSAFLIARSQELAPGGLMAILVPCQPEGTSPVESVTLHILECLGDILNDMVKEGIVREEDVEDFNIPWFFPTITDMKQILDLSGTPLIIERVQEMYHQSRLEDIPVPSSHIRAAMENTFSRHFGVAVSHELFSRYPKKLQDFIDSPLFLTYPETRQKTLFMVLKRNGGF